MKAVIFNQFGAANELHIADIEKPTPKSNEVLIRIHATSVTAEDPKMRGFNHPPLLKIPVGLMFGFKKPKNPILGMEFSGIIESMGLAVKTYKAGDQVFGYTGLSFGAYAEYKCMPENSLIHIKPDNLSFEESACLVNGPLSALVYLKKKGKIKKGDKVLIYGASGSVGTAAVQLAKYFGAHVTGVCSSKNISLIKSIGADIAIDYTSEDFTQQQTKYDLIFDTVGKTSMRKCMSSLKPQGKYLLTEFGSAHIFAALASSFRSLKVVIASSNFHWRKKDLAFLKEVTEKGHFKPVIDKVYPLDRIVDAHEYVESGHKVGNVAISVR
ncbi:MAG: NAD(P)-dependent alcohol dehydrogenase [Marinoscillum sp.]